MMDFYWHLITDLWRVFKRYADCQSDEQIGEALRDLDYIAKRYVEFGVPEHTAKFIGKLAVTLMEEIDANYSDNLKQRRGKEP